MYSTKKVDIYFDILFFSVLFFIFIFLIILYHYLFMQLTACQYQPTF